MAGSSSAIAPLARIVEVKSTAALMRNIVAPSQRSLLATEKKLDAIDRRSRFVSALDALCRTRERRRPESRSGPCARGPAWAAGGDRRWGRRADGAAAGGAGPVR